MGYTVIKAFERGIDTRKLLDTIEAGALLDARDCHMTLGGEIEKRAAFVTVATLPPETIGLYVTEGRVLNTWGDSLTAPTGMPPNSVYWPIPDPAGAPLARILSIEEFMGSLYVVAQYEPDMDHPAGRILHWWQGNLVTYPPPSAGSGGTGGTPPDTTPGSKPTCTFQLQIIFASTAPDVYVTAIYLKSPTITTPPVIGTNLFMLIPTSGVDGAGWPYCDTEIVSGPVHPSEVIGKITNLMNAFLQTPVDVSCQIIDPTPGIIGDNPEDGIQFWLEDSSSAYNGWSIEIRLTNCLVHPTNSQVLTGGEDPAVIPGTGTPPTPPVSGVPGAPVETKADFVLSHNKRMWGTWVDKLNFSEEKHPNNWEDTTTTQENQFDFSTITSRAPKLLSIAEYRSDLAIFGRRHIICYHMDAQLEQSYKRFVLQGTGTFAPHSVTCFGEGEVMYLDISGIRSLRARDSTDMGFAADIGNMIDELVKSKIAVMTADEKKFNVWGVVDQRSGRLWMALHDKIFVLSYYPTSRISAWTWYDATTAPVDYMNNSDDSVYWRSVDDVICYGDVDGTTYDDTEALIRIPYIDAAKPASMKNWTGLDMAIYGTWSVKGSFDPTAPTALDLLATLTKSSYAQQTIAVNGESPGLSLELRSTFVGAAKVGNATVHYTDSTAD